MRVTQSNLRLVHIFNDDKFVDNAITLFESVIPGGSDYYVLSPVPKLSSVIDQKALPLLIEDDAHIQSFIESLPVNSCVLFHALCSRKQRIALKLSREIVTVWFIWGYDLYRQWPFFKRNIYSNATKSLLAVESRWRQVKFHTKYNKITKFLYLSNLSKRNILKKVGNKIYESQFYLAAKRMNVVVPIVPPEAEFVRDMGLNPIFATFNYSCLEWLTNNVTLNADATNFLVGNSGDPSNNHIDMFRIIGKLPLKDQKIYVPLSYAGSKEYVEQILEIGRKQFGSKFCPLMTYMSLSDYNKIVATCGFVFFNHSRQQALGNVIASMQMGAKIFLNSQSPIYHYFKTYKFALGLIDQIELSDVNKLTELEIKKNRELLKALYSLEAVERKVASLVQIINHENLKLNG